MQKRPRNTGADKGDDDDDDDGADRPGASERACHLKHVVIEIGSSGRLGRKSNRSSEYDEQVIKLHFLGQFNAMNLFSDF